MKITDIITEDIEGEEHLTPELAQKIVDKFKARGADELERSLEWGDGAACDLRNLLIQALEKYAAGEETLEEAEYQGRKVQLNKPMQGDSKKYKVYVKDPKTGNIKKVNFGDPNMKIRRDDPERRKSFRARHGCGTERASDRTKAAYWSCKMWSKTPVSKIIKGK